MDKKIIATWFFNLGCFLQDQVIPKLLEKSRKHNLILLNIEKVVILFYRWAIWLNPSFSKASYKLGRLFQRRKKWQEAAIAFEQVTKIDCFELADAYCNLGRMLLKLKRFGEGAAALNQAIKLEPEQSWYYRIMGNILSEKGEISEAIKYYQIAGKRNISKTHPHVDLKSDKKQHLSTPNFIIIGQPKCGTSSLYSYLIQHPQILPAIEKEINFWNYHLDKGIDWYLAHFPAVSSEQDLITGEATPNYLSSKEIALSLFQEFPHMKLIVLLRNPVDRAISHYYVCAKPDSDNRSLEKAILSGLESITNKSNINSPNDGKINYYIKLSQYIESLSKWMEIFPREQFLILRSEDLFSDPAATVNEVFQFLEVKPYQLKEYNKKNAGNYPPISQSMRQALNDYFRPYNQQLEGYLDRKFNWDS